MEREDCHFEYKREYAWVWVKSESESNPYLEYAETVTRELRHNYELTDNGPIQIPTLPGIDWDSLNDNL